MKCLPFALILLCACSAKKPIEAHLVIPTQCIREVKGTTQTICRPVDGAPDWAQCNGVLVKFACTKVIK